MPCYLGGWQEKDLQVFMIYSPVPRKLSCSKMLVSASTMLNVKRRQVVLIRARQLLGLRLDPSAWLAIQWRN